MTRTSRSRSLDRATRYEDPLNTINPAYWTQAYDLNPSAFDQLSVYDGFVTCANPNSGPISSAVDGAYHGAAWHDFGAEFADNFEVDFWWSGIRAIEASPLLHVNTAADKLGVGIWPTWDLLPGSPIQSIWGVGWIGLDNTKFGYDASTRSLTVNEHLQYSPNPPGETYRPPFGAPVKYPYGPYHPHKFTLRSCGGYITMKIDDQWADGVKLAIPVELVGSTKHGFAIDGNHADGNLGLGGPRPANIPCGRGPFVIRRI